MSKLIEIEEIEKILSQVNVPSKDDGRRFINLRRLNFIKNLLNKGNFGLLKKLNLSLIYKHKKYSKTEPAILISCHIDALYSKYFYKKYRNTELLGTFDNSICNAILLYLMVKDELPPNILIAFTGDEEGNSKGAKETADYLGENGYKPSMAIVLDITGEGYDKYSFTIENYFPKELKGYLKKLLKDYRILRFISSDDADEDESRIYASYNINCFSFCFPARPHPDNEDENSDVWMHSDKGILIKKHSIKSYTEALLKLLKEINKEYQT